MGWFFKTHLKPLSLTNLGAVMKLCDCFLIRVYLPIFDLVDSRHKVDTSSINDVRKNNLLSDFR